jgi:PQQ-dependent dehydrogenase (s-GDH family)
MSTRLLLIYFILSLITVDGISQSETFTPKRVVNPTTNAGRFRHPFAMVMGPDDSLWITERRGYVMKVSTVNGGKHQLLDVRTQVRFTSSAGSISQDGMLGIALHPELNMGTGNDKVFLAWCYDSVGLRRVRIVRYDYNRNVPSLTNPIVIMRGLHGSNDHNAGKLMIGNYGTSMSPDYKLVYSCGDRGANQFSNACDSIESQYIPTLADVQAGNIRRYNGKILRMNLDGSIPSDNPVINGSRTHIFSFGHRNPQGLYFQRDNNNDIIPGGKLYSSEMGPASNDEVNVIESGKNYGWPRVAGVQDNHWYKYYKWAGTAGCSSYGGECSSNQVNLGSTESSFSSPVYANPIFDLYPGIPPGGTSCNYLLYPTIAPSSIVHYPFSLKIPGWENSLLITTLKTGAMYRLKLNASGDAALSVSDSVIQYFREPTALNRYRDIALGKDGITFFLLTDSIGGTSGPTAGMNGGITDRGSILEFRYSGALLSLPTDPAFVNNEKLLLRMYPNPASKVLFIESKRNVSKPISYQIFDMSGRPVLSGSSSRDKTEVNIQRLLPGVYTVRMFNGRDVMIQTEKIIVQR